jgi:hypothetical protein
MKKYKLIKEYPGSPEVDTEIIKSYISNSSLGNYDTYMIKGEDWFKLDDPENYPEFWKLIIEKDYEILSFKVSNGYLYNKINNSDDYLLEENVCDGETNTYDNMINNINYKIHSVKRLSDGEIFTVGDKLIDNYIIREFEIKNNNLLTWFQKESFSSYIKPIQGKSGNSQFDYINSLKKIKQSLFTTEDGVDVFEGDNFYNINNKDWLLRNIIKINLLDYQTYYKNQINFSTKEKAEEYILMNKPCLSLNDVATIYKGINKKTNHPSSQANQLKNLVKQKLNNNN